MATFTDSIVFLSMSFFSCTCYLSDKNEILKITCKKYLNCHQSLQKKIKFRQNGLKNKSQVLFQLTVPT